MARNRRSTRKSKKNKKKQLLIELIALLIVLISSAFGISSISNEENKNETKTTTIRENQDLFKATSSVENVENDLNFDEGLYIYYFDVGQADSSLVISENKTMLIDAGNNEDGKLIVNYLKELGIKKIDALVGTHPHEDHIGGLDDIIDSFEIGNIYMPKVANNTKTFEDVLDSISEKNLSVTAPNIGDKFSVGAANIEILFADNNYSGTSYNDCSIVLNLNYEDQNFLFMADAEKNIESQLTPNKVTVLKVGHHGSSTSSSYDFIKNISPDAAIISCGENNDYNHPHKETLTTLDKVHSKVYRTDEKGTILIKSAGFILDISFLDVSLDGNKE